MYDVTSEYTFENLEMAILCVKYRQKLIFVSPEHSSERDYVITDSVRSMCVVCM